MWRHRQHYKLLDKGSGVHYTYILPNSQNLVRGKKFSRNLPFQDNKKKGKNGKQRIKYGENLHIRAKGGVVMKKKTEENQPISGVGKKIRCSRRIYNPAKDKSRNKF